jgi:hypothetical protein
VLGLEVAGRQLLIFFAIRLSLIGWLRPIGVRYKDDLMR